MIAIQAIKTSNQTLYQYMEQLITQPFRPMNIAT